MQFTVGSLCFKVSEYCQLAATITANTDCNGCFQQLRGSNVEHACIHVHTKKSTAMNKAFLQ